jgi:hypothetical protein
MTAAAPAKNRPYKREPATPSPYRRRRPKRRAPAAVLAATTSLAPPRRDGAEFGHARMLRQRIATDATHYAAETERLIRPLRP